MTTIPPELHFPSPYARPSMPPVAALRVPMEDGAQIATFVYAPEGLRDEPGTPFGIDRSIPPVLMIHGNGEEHGIFGPTVDAVVASGRSVIALDARAQGKSSRGTAPLTYELLAADALEVCSRLGVTQMHVLGFSDGAIEGLLMARDHPTRVLTLLALGANLTPDGVMAEPGWDIAGLVAANRTWAEERFGTSVDTSLLMPTPDEARATAELLQLMLDEPHIEASSLAAISCPVTVMVGEFDCIADYETVEIYQALRDARLVVVPGEGHVLPKHAPDAVTRELFACIARNDRRLGAGTRREDDGSVRVVRVPVARTDLLEALETLYADVTAVVDDSSGWRAGIWPPEGLVRSYAERGLTWAAFDADDVDEAGAPREGAHPLGAISIDDDADLGAEEEPDWETLAHDEVLGMHLLAVDPAARGRRIAVAILRECERISRARGVRAFRFNTSPENVAANRSYHGFGMTLHKSVRLPYPGLPISAWTNPWEFWLD